MVSRRMSSAADLRARVRAFVEAERFKQTIMVLIVVNAITLGLDTVPSVDRSWGPALDVIDHAILAVFVVEVALRIFAHRGAFFRDGWSLFDLGVVAIALMPYTGPLSVLRALRILRAFRLVAAIPQMRVVVEALLKSIPGLSAIIALLVLVFYVFAVMATRLFGETNPEIFGTLGGSLFTLFQLMTLEGWVSDIVKPVLEHHPYAMAFFLPFMLLSTFTVLNLFIALIVDSMQKMHKSEADPDEEAAARELRRLAAEVERLRAAIEGARAGPVG